MCPSQPIQHEPNTATETLTALYYSEDFEDFECELSASDCVKIYCERLVGQQLIWWPLKEPARPLPSGIRRFAYKCVRSCQPETVKQESIC